jgi:hypothetical protein
MLLLAAAEPSANHSRCGGRPGLRRRRAAAVEAESSGLRPDPGVVPHPLVRSAITGANGSDRWRVHAWPT